MTMQMEQLPESQASAEPTKLANSRSDMLQVSRWGWSGWKKERIDADVIFGFSCIIFSSGGIRLTDTTTPYLMCVRIGLRLIGASKLKLLRDRHAPSQNKDSTFGEVRNAVSCSNRWSKWRATVRELCAYPFCTTDSIRFSHDNSLHAITVPASRRSRGLLPYW